jgi:hypothetical protein
MLATARTSLACSYAVDSTALRATPAAGSDDVPTDVAILLDLSWANLDNSLPLPEGFATLRKPDGEVVPSSVERVAIWHAEVRPAAVLEPDTSYELIVQMPNYDGAIVPKTARFSTGAGPLDVELEPPVAALQHWVFAPDVELNSCSPGNVGTCVALPAGEFVEWTFLLADRTDPQMGTYLSEGPFTTDITADTSSHPYRCLRLRRRAANGSYSEPTVLCGADAPTVELAGSFTCGPRGIVQPDLPPESSSSDDPSQTVDDDDTSGDDLAGDDLAGDDVPGAGDLYGDRPTTDGRAASGCALGSRSTSGMPLAAIAALTVAFWRRRRS